MSKLLRYHRGSDTCFITAVTHSRVRILENNTDILLDTFTKYTRKLDYRILSYVIMPDHFHLLVDCNGNDLSSIMKKTKLSFSKQYRNRIGHQKMKIWQTRFWDHIIRDQNDLNRHFDYIHYNPVKHGYVRSPLDWEYSTFAKYYHLGYYDSDWGLKEIEFNDDFGE